MTDKIKVWVASSGCIHGVIGARGGLHYVTENVRDQPSEKSLERLRRFGWTVQPYTLVKGHDHD